jgi:hypothetical protein
VNKNRTDERSNKEEIKEKKINLEVSSRESLLNG